MPLLHLTRGEQGVTGQVVDVQLDRGRAGLFERVGVVGPPAGGDAVEAGDHRDVHSGGRAFQQAQVAARAGAGVGGGRKVGQRLGEAFGPGVGQRRVGGRFAAQLLLEQGVEHDRADAGVGQPADAVGGVR